VLEDRRVPLEAVGIDREMNLAQGPRFVAESPLRVRGPRIADPAAP